jgi:hypothetical protein
MGTVQTGKMNRSKEPGFADRQSAAATAFSADARQPPSAFSASDGPHDALLDRGAISGCSSAPPLAKFVARHPDIVASPAAISALLLVDAAIAEMRR